jgi:hypothetical protein
MMVEQFPKEMVISVPVAIAIERYDKQVTVF